MQDLALAVARAIYNVGSLIPETRQLQLPYVAFLLVILQALPLAWRRRWPIAVFFAVGIPRAIYDQLSLNFAPIPLGPAIAYYTIMDRCSTRVRIAISALLLYGIVRSQMLPGPADVDGRATTAPSPSISQLDDLLRPVRQAGIAVDLRVEGSPSKLPPGVDLAAYRIVQEALTNTVKHSGACEAAVTVSYEPGYVTVSVTDTGNGAVAITVDGKASRAPGRAAARDGGGPRLADSGGFGLAGIAERVASCGGKLTVGPGDAGRLAATARLPTPRPHADLVRSLWQTDKDSAGTESCRAWKRPT